MPPGGDAAMSTTTTAAPPAVSWLAWYAPEFAGAAVLAAVGVTVAAPVLPFAAVPVGMVMVRDLWRIHQNRRVRARTLRRIQQQHTAIEAVPVEEPKPAPVQATAVRLDRPLPELENGPVTR